MRNLKQVILSSLFGFFILNASAQKGTQSPYSVFGLGELNNGQYAYFMGMGNARTANTDSTIVNQFNPASYSYISRHRPLFQIGINGKFSNYSEGTNSSSQRQFGLNQFQLGMPIAKNWGAAFGLTPYSSTGYKIFNTQLDGADTVSQLINEGSGTVSKFHLGTGYKHKFSSTSSLAIGVNMNYIFGQSNKIESFEYYAFPAFALHSRVEHKLRLGSLNMDLGLVYEQQFEKSSFSLGLKYTPTAQLKAFQDLLAYNYSESYYNNYSYPYQIIDTAEYISDNQGLVNLPESYAVGVEYRLTGAEKTYLLKLSADVKFQKWSDYYEEFNGTKTNTGLTDRLETAFGLQYSPHVGRNGNNNLTPWLGKLHYRLGFNYTLTELYVNSTQLKDYGISFGLGIPVTTGFSNTNLNLGMKLGSLGQTDSGLIKENYMGVYFGVTISPGVYDRWFLKRKYD